jgi:hypothetical protein
LGNTPRTALIVASELSGDGIRQLVRALGDEDYHTTWMTTVEHDAVLGAVSDLCASATDDGIMLLAFVGAATHQPTAEWELTFDGTSAGVSARELNDVWAASAATKIVMLDCFAAEPETLAAAFAGATVLTMSSAPLPGAIVRIATCTAFIADAIGHATGQLTVDDVRASVERDAPAGTHVELVLADPATPAVLVAPPPPSAVLDDDVRFTVYRPRAVAPDRWYSMVAFAHKTEPYDDPVRGRIDPEEEVDRIATHVLDGAEARYDHTDSDARTSLVRGSELRFVPYVEGVEFNPKVVAFTWFEPVHYENFRLRASSAIDGTRARGTLSVFQGATLVGDVTLTIQVDAEAAAHVEPEKPDVTDDAPSYRKIFASYSHDDVEIVKLIGKFMTATGDRFMRDWVELRSGEVWDDRLLQMIRDADVFELFWSQNSMESAYVRREWEYALSLGRENFVRPVFWERPMPERVADGLPPPELARLHFQAIDFDFDAARASAGATPPPPNVVQFPAPPAPPSAPLPTPRRRRRWVAAAGGLAASLVGVAAVGAGLIGAAGTSSARHDTAASTTPSPVTTPSPIASSIVITEASTDADLVCVASPPETTRLTVTVRSGGSAPASLEARVTLDGVLIATPSLLPEGSAGDEQRYSGTLGPFEHPGLASWLIQQGNGAEGDLTVGDC